MFRKNIYFYFGSLCILASFLLFSHNLVEDYKAGTHTKEVVTELEQKIKVAKDSSQKDFSQKERYIENPKMEMPTEKIGGCDYIGYLKIEKLKLNLPIASCWSYPQLRISPARFSGSIYSNDFLILAHNYREHFGTIYQLSEDDQVEFVDMNNNKFIYRVKSVEEIEEDEIDKLLKGDWDLTLFTCTLVGNSRTVVRCKIEKQDPLIKISKED